MNTKNGGKKKKSTSKATTIVTAVIKPMSEFIEKSEIASTAKLAKRIKVVTSSATPTVLKA